MNEHTDYFTLFDDEIVAELVSATGADTFTALFMVALDRGLDGDADLSQPATQDAMFPELLQARVSFDASPALELLVASVTVGGGTALLRRRDSAAVPA